MIPAINHHADFKQLHRSWKTSSLTSLICCKCLKVLLHKNAEEVPALLWNRAIMKEMFAGIVPSLACLNVQHLVPKDHAAAQTGSSTISDSRALKPNACLPTWTRQRQLTAKWRKSLSQRATHAPTKPTQNLLDQPYSKNQRAKARLYTEIPRELFNPLTE